MSGIMHKIGETLHMGGNKEEEKHHGSGSDQHHKEGDHHYKEGDHHKSDDHHGGEHKEGLVDKIKDKIHGDGGHDEKGEKKKKKKEKKKHEHGHEHHGDSSSSDSD